MSYHGSDREERAEGERDGDDSTAMGRRSYMRIAATTGALLGVGVGGGGDEGVLVRPAYAYASDGTEVLRAGESIPVTAGEAGSADDPRATTTVGVDERVDGDLASDGDDWFATDAPGGEELTLTFERISGSGTAAVAVYGADGAFVDMVVEGAASNELTVTPDATGTLFAQVVGLGGGGGTYAFGVREGASESRAVSPSAAGARVWVEAESARDGANFAPFEVRSDAAAANGEYITTPDEGRDNYDGPPAEGYAEYTFEVPADGEYAVWGRTRVQSNGNTFYVGLDDGGVDTEWHIDMADGWNWVEMPLSATLSAGTHKLTVAYREDGTALDKLLVTSDSDFQPSGTGGGTASTPTQSPFTDHDPSRIEAEAYDEGGEGVAYHDTTAGNEGGAFRDDGVDVESTAGGGHNVGWVHDGEWLEYTVDLPAGKYDLRARLASTDGGARLRATLDGDHLGTFDVPDTDGWQAWETVTLPGVESAGGSVLRLEAVGGGFNVNWVGFAEPDSSAPSTPPSSTPDEVTVSGELKEWHTVTLTFDGPHASESGAPNPFRDYRLQVEFQGPSGQSYDVPGFFAGDGDGGSSGTAWRCRFSPDEAGEWSFEASFRAGDDVAVSLDDGAGAPTAFDGASGTFSVATTDKSGRDFRAHGTLTNHGGHYLRHADGTYWLKGGPNVPENFLAHDFDAHGGRAGAIDYVADAGCNCLYFLPNNVGGDGDDTCPHPERYAKTRYDVSKLREWCDLFEHAESRGVLLHLVLAETEHANETYYDDGSLGPQRKLYYRELVSRFGHVLGIEWNVGEENDYSTADHEAFADYLHAVDPYDHPVSVHIRNDDYDTYDPLLGNGDIDMTSFQVGQSEASLSDTVADWRDRSSDAGEPWVVSVDEGGVEVDDLDEGRREEMWPTYMGGGGGYEWYIKYPSNHGLDQSLDDFSRVEPALEWTGYALDFLSSLPLHRMAPDHGRISNGAGYCLAADDGDAVALYLPDGGTVGVDLPDGSFDVDWFDPETGAEHGGGTVAGGDGAELGPPPFGGDGAAVLRD